MSDYERLPYEFFSPADVMNMRTWLNAHDVPCNQVPTDALIEFDESTGEWRIEKWKVVTLANGDPVAQLNAAGDDIERIIVRRTPRRGHYALPWPVTPAGQIVLGFDAARDGTALAYRMPDGRIGTIFDEIKRFRAVSQTSWP